MSDKPLTKQDIQNDLRDLARHCTEHRLGYIESCSVIFDELRKRLPLPVLLISTLVKHVDEGTVSVEAELNTWEGHIWVSVPVPGPWWEPTTYPVIDKTHKGPTMTDKFGVSGMTDKHLVQPTLDKHGAKIEADKFVSPDQPPEGRNRELLTVLSEEGTEIIEEAMLLIQAVLGVQKRCSKTVRFGLNEVQPGQELSNAQRLGQEIGDLQCVINMLVARGVIDRKDINDGYEAKRRKLATFLQCED